MPGAGNYFATTATTSGRSRTRPDRGRSAMARFFGRIGYGESVELRLVYGSIRLLSSTYYGDVVRNTRNLRKEKILMSISAFKIRSAS